MKELRNQSFSLRTESREGGGGRVQAIPPRRVIRHSNKGGKLAANSVNFRNEETQKAEQCSSEW